jgi:hypothetical protein
VKKPRKTPKRKEKEEEYRPVRDILLRLFYIALGIGVTIPILDETGPLRFIGLMLLFSGYHLFMLVFVDLYVYVSSFFPDEDDVRVTRYDYLKTFGYSSGFFLLGLICIIGSYETINHTIHGMELFWLSAAAGIILAALLLTWFLRRRKGLVPGNYAYVIILQFGIGCTLTTIAAAENLNRFFTSQDYRTFTASVYDKHISSKRAKRQECYYLFVELDGQTERIEVSQSFYFSCGKTVKVRTENGLFGYAYINRLKLAE